MIFFIYYKWQFLQLLGPISQYLDQTQNDCFKIT